jgi:hypothetical protein
MARPGSRRSLIAPAASPEEAAAIVAALERFLRDTARADGQVAPEQTDGWRRAALLEGVRGTVPPAPVHPWINT